MGKSGHPEKKDEKKEIKVPHGKPKQESLREPAEELNNQLSRIERRIKNRERVQLKENDMVGKYKVIDVIAPDSGINEIYVVQHEETQDVNCMKVKTTYLGYYIIALQSLSVSLIETRAEKFPILKTELFILLEIRKKADVKHFCKVYDRGQEERFNYVVLTLAGPSLRNLRRDMPNKKLSLGCGLSVGKQCLQALEELHRIGFVHRDVGPSNFCCGRREFEEERKIYFVDFCFCHQYRDSTTGALKRPRLKPTRYMGSSRHAPRAAYLGMELSRADDLESWFYMFVELIKGGLPWMTFQDPTEIYKYQRKCRTGLEKHEMLGGLPKQIETMMNLIDRLSYYDDPDYGAIYTLIDEAMVKNNVQEHPYDWELKPGEPAAEGAAAAAPADGAAAPAAPPAAPAAEPAK
uniref:Protein kinase domain-containing protein n=1 Tax=Pristionchus pacificus TaxID=54126 RepID=A0A8R1UUF0_PRIPA